MVGIVRLSFLLAGARAELVGLEVLVEPVALVVSAELEALEVSVELVATGGSTTLHTAGALRIGIVLRRIDLAGQLAETPLPTASLALGNRLVDRAAILPAIVAAQVWAIVLAAVQVLAAGAVERGGATGQPEAAQVEQIE
jgi:hypothetical protein